MLFKICQKQHTILKDSLAHVMPIVGRDSMEAILNYNFPIVVKHGDQS